jgi:hypothetical protein
LFFRRYIHTTRPILVFVRRPDNYWRIYNIGRGPAFDVRFEDRGKREDQVKPLRIYPIAEKDKVELGPLDYGLELTAYYATRSGWRRYKTLCTVCENHIESMRKLLMVAFVLPGMG